MACIKKYFAKNGQESKLFSELRDRFGENRAEEIYLRTHSEEFKNWFGDWESGKPNNGLDENGEPKIFWLNVDGEVMNYDQALKSSSQDIKITDKNVDDAFTKYLETAIEGEEKFNNIKNELGVKMPDMDLPLPGRSPGVRYPVFLSLRPGEGATEMVDGSTYRASFDRVPTGKKYKRIVSAWPESNSDLRGDSFRNENLYLISGFYKSDVIRGLFSNPYFDSVIEGDAKLQKLSPEEMAYNLRESAKVIGEPKGSSYSVAGQTVDRVSTVVDSKKQLKYHGDEKGEKYADKGTKYHKIAERMINALGPEGVPDVVVTELIKFYELNQNETGYVNSMRLLINNLHKQGGQLLTETRVANLAANKGKGVAGTLDIIHIRKDGFADIYDIKTAHETPWKRNESVAHNISKDPWDISDYDFYKAQRYSHQLMLYAQMLESADDKTGRRPIKVRNVYVVPVEVYYTPDEQIRGAQMLRPENIKSWSVGKRQFYREGQRWAEGIITGKEATRIPGISTSSTVDEFLPKALGVDFTVKDTSKYARNFVEQHWSDKTFKLNGKTSGWVSDNKSERIMQVKELIEQQDENMDMNIVNATNLFFNGQYTSIFKGGNQEDGEPNNTSTAGVRLAKTLANARAVDVLPLMNVPGFDMYDDISLIERADGTYDMLKISRERIDETFEIANKESNIIRNTLDKAGELATNSILGNQISAEEARAKRITLRNSWGDYHRMRMGLIAMELANGSNIKVNRIIVDSLSDYSNNVGARAVPAADIVRQIKVMYDIPTVKPLANGYLKDILDAEESYNVDLYKGDPVNELIDYMSNQLDDKDFSYKNGNPNARAKIQSLLYQYKNNEITKDNLAYELLNGVNGLRRLLRDKYGSKANTEELISEDPEFRMLALAIADLKGISFSPEKDITNEFFGFISKFLKAPYATGRQTVDKTFDIIRQYHDNIKHEIVSYNNEKKPYLNQLIRQSPLLKRGLAIGENNLGGTDAIFAMGQSVFDDLFQTTVNKDGVKGRLPMLKAEGSAEFNNLTSAEKEFIRYFNRTMKKYNPKWPTGLVPLMHVSANTLLYRGKKSAVSGDVKSAGSFLGRSFMRTVQTAAHRGKNILEEDTQNTILDSVEDNFDHTFVEGTGDFKTNILNKYGLDEQLQLIDPVKNEEFETNLEEVMTRFVTHYVKKSQYDKALPAFQVMRSILKTYEMAYGLDQTNTIEMLDTYVKDLVFNIKQNEDKVVTTVVTAGVNSASIALLGWNLPVYVNNAIQMWSSGFVDSLTNTMTADPRFAGVKQFAQAGGIMIKAMNPSGDMELAHRLRLMKDKYLPDDLAVLTGTRNQKTASGLVNSQMAFALDRSTEYTIRTQHLIAQMLKDGSFDAHKAVQVKSADGFYRWELVYDPKLDKRFQGEDGKLLYNRLKETQGEKGELTEAGELSMAYDWRLRARLQAYINRQVGSFDKDLGSHMSRFGIAYALTQFRTWFRDRFVRSTKIEYDGEIFGNYVKKGNEVVWENDTMKGILWTFADLFSIAKRYAKDKTIAPADARNLMYATNSLAALFVGYAILAALWDDEKDIPTPIAAAFTRYYSDSISFLTLDPFASITANPVVFISYYQRMFTGLSKAISYGVDGEDEKMMEAFNRVLPKVVQQTVINEE